MVVHRCERVGKAQTVPCNDLAKDLGDALFKRKRVCTTQNHWGWKRSLEIQLLRFNPLLTRV